MLPTVPQRTAMLVLVVVTSIILIWAAGPAMPPGGWSGLTVMDAQSSILVAALTLGFAALPAVLAGVGMAAWAGVATGAFTVAASLTILAWYTGPIDGLLFRTESLRHIYLDLAIEMIGWTFLWSIMLLVAGILHTGIRDKHDRHHTSTSATFAALGITAILGAVIANLLAKSTDAGQVVGALVIGFAVAGWIARASVPSTRAWGLLISPLIVGLGVYLMASFNFTSDEMLQSSWFSGRMTGLALMLPIYFASAGVAGAAIGYGLGRPRHD